MFHVKKPYIISLSLWTLQLYFRLTVSTPPNWVDTLPYYSDPTGNPLLQVAVDYENGGDVFVGGRNVLYHFSADLVLKNRVSIGPLDDSPGCPIPPYHCDQARVPTNNDVRILKVVYHLTTSPSLLVCGTVYRSLCQIRPAGILDAYQWVHPYNDSVGYTTSGVLSYAFLERGYGGEWSLFTATMDSYIERTQHSAAFLSRKILEKDGERFQFRHSLRNGTVLSSVTFQGSSSRFPIDGGFVYENFTYFPVLYFLGVSLTESRLVRFCTADPTFHSYAELPIRCNFKGKIIKRIMASHFGDSSSTHEKSLYTIFNDDSAGSALCIFKMASVVEAFTTSPRNCNRDVVGETCDREREANVDFCGVGVRPYVVIQPLEIGYFLFLPKVLLQSITVMKQYDEFVAIVGTNVGLLIKVSMSTGQVITFSDMLNKTETGAIRSPFVFDQEEKHIYLLINNKVVKYPVASCGSHTTCELCMTRGKRDPLKCGWCGGRCAQMQECREPGSFSLHTCTPTIYEVFPLKAPIQGNSIIRIIGESLGSYVDDDHNHISVAGIPCKVLFWNNSEVNCSLGSTTEELSGPVQLHVINTLSSTLGYNIAGSTSSHSNFSYYAGPRIYGIRPGKGPTSGGTNVTLFGENLDFDKDKKRTVSIRGRPCALKRFNKSTITCVTGNASRPELPTYIALHIDGTAYVMDKNPPPNYNLTGLAQSFEYATDPYISHIRPGMTTLSGLMNATAVGRHLDSIQFPRIVVKVDQTQIIGDNEFEEACWIDPKSNGTLMSCRTPSLAEKMVFPIPTRTHPLVTRVSFLMDGVRGMRDFDKNRNDLSQLLYYPDPQFRAFPETLKINTEQKVLEIKGNYMDLLHFADNLRVRIGKDESCKIKSVSSDILFCELPSGLLSNSSAVGTNISVEILTGPTVHQLGYIDLYQPNEDNLWYLWLIGAFVILLGVIFVFYKYCSRIKKLSHIDSVGLSERNPVQNDYRRVPTGTTPTRCSVNLAPESPANELPPMDKETRLLLAENNLIIPKKNLTRSKQIDSGHFGCVFRGYLKLSNREQSMLVAVKTLRENSWSDPLAVSNFLREALIMQAFDHPNVLGLLGVCFEESVPSIVIPFMEKGNLLNYIRDDKKTILKTELLNFAVDVAAGMSYLETARFLHRDLAARNCLLSSTLSVKVADFGLSRDIYEEADYVQKNKKAMLPYKWMAPESLEKAKFSTKSDVWSYGVLLWELMTRGVKPYCNVDNYDMPEYLQLGNRLHQPKCCPLPLYRYVMLACWNYEPNRRPSFYQLHEAVSFILHDILVNTQEAEDMLAAEAMPAAEDMSTGEAVPAMHTEYYNSKDLYLSMEGRPLKMDVLKKHS